MSRRCISYDMQGLSFREYLKRMHNISFPVYSLEDILTKTDKIFSEVNKKIRPLQYFHTYFQEGYYPLAVLSSEVPMFVDISKLFRLADITRNTVLPYLQYLDSAKIICLLYEDDDSVKKMQKPDKILMENTNILHALAQHPVDIGTQRETFFCNQIGFAHRVEYSKKDDYIIDKQYTFGIGGKNKDGKQVAKTENSFIAADNTECATGNKQPLWLFGFMY